MLQGIKERLQAGVSISSEWRPAHVLNCTKQQQHLIERNMFQQIHSRLSAMSKKFKCVKSSNVPATASDEGEKVSNKKSIKQLIKSIGNKVKSSVFKKACNKIHIKTKTNKSKVSQSPLINANSCVQVPHNSGDDIAVFDFSGLFRDASEEPLSLEAPFKETSQCMALTRYTPIEYLLVRWKPVTIKVMPAMKIRLCQILKIQTRCQVMTVYNPMESFLQRWSSAAIQKNIEMEGQLSVFRSLDSYLQRWAALRLASVAFMTMSNLSFPVFRAHAILIYVTMSSWQFPTKIEQVPKLRLARSCSIEAIEALDEGEDGDERSILDL